MWEYYPCLSSILSLHLPWDLEVVISVAWGDEFFHWVLKTPNKSREFFNPLDRITPSEQRTGECIIYGENFNPKARGGFHHWALKELCVSMHFFYFFLCQTHQVPFMSNSVHNCCNWLVSNSVFCHFINHKWK